jgi:hypothetical protein
MNAAWPDIVAALFLVAVVYILVKPSSLAPAFVKNVGDALDSIVTFAVNG